LAARTAASEGGHLERLVEVDDAAGGVSGGVDGGDDRGDGVSDDDGRLQLRLLDGTVYTLGDAFHIVGGPFCRLTVAGKVQRDDASAGVNAAQLGQRGSPQAAIEGQTVEQDQRRSSIGLAVVVCGESGQGPHDAVLLLAPRPGSRRSRHLHHPPVFPLSLLRYSIT
jgi:hypothetical protein